MILNQKIFNITIGDSTVKLLENSSTNRTNIGRRKWEVVISDFKINYFKLMGIRFQLDMVDNVAPPNDKRYVIDTYIRVGKIFLTSKTNIDRFYIIGENVDCYIPLDFYYCYVELFDYDDSGYASIIADSNNIGINNILSGYAPQHLQDDMLTPNPLTQTVSKYSLKACAYAEALTHIKNN